MCELNVDKVGTNSMQYLDIEVYKGPVESRHAVGVQTIHQANITVPTT